MKKTILFALTCCMALIFSCSKDNNKPDNKKKTAKFTISAPGLNSEEGDRASMTLTGGSGSGGTTTVWKINGVTQENQINIAIKDEMLFGGKTVTVETATPLEFMNLAISGINVGTPYNINFKAVVNGQDKNNMSEPVAGTFVKSFTY